MTFEKPEVISEDAEKYIGKTYPSIEEIVRSEKKPAEEMPSMIRDATVEGEQCEWFNGMISGKWYGRVELYRLPEKDGNPEEWYLEHKPAGCNYKRFFSYGDRTSAAEEFRCIVASILRSMLEDMEG